VRGDDPDHARRVERRSVGRSELAGENYAGGSLRRGLTGEGAHDAAPHVEYVSRALLQERLLQRPVAIGDRERRVVEGALGGGAGIDRPLGWLEQRLVVEQHQVRVEDRRLGLAGAAGDGLAVLLDRRTGGGDRLAEAFVLPLVGGAIRRRAERASKVVRGPGGDTGRRRHATQHVARLRGRGGRRCRRRRGRHARWRRRAACDPVTKSIIRKSLKSRDRIVGLGTGGTHEQRVAEPCAERDDVGQTGGAHRRAVGCLGHSYVGVEPAGGFDEPGRWTRVQADGVADVERGLHVPRGSRFRGGELPGLHRQGPARLGRYLLERRAAARRRRRSHRALDQRRLAQQYATRRILEQLHRELGAHQRAPQVHQNQDAIGRHRALDRRPHALGVGADHPRLLGAAGGLEGELLAAHLPGQGHDALRQRVAVRHHHDADHVRARRRGAGSRSDGPTFHRWRA